jgi:exonuclease III
MAFRKKANFILAEKPDILIIPECEHPDKLIFKPGTKIPNAIIWQGSNKNKGLGVFSYGTYNLKLLDIHNPDIKTILPISVTGPSYSFILLAIWAYHPQDREYNYIGQVWKAIHYYEELLKSENIIMAGDFNSNAIWDKLHRKSNHSMVVEKLIGLNIFSTYHQFKNQVQGSEQHPTFFLYRHKNKPYHIDYCFASSHLLSELKDVKIGTHNKWATHSDHNPVIITFTNQVAETMA